MQKTLLTLLALSMATGVAMAEVIYVTARPSPCTVTANCPGANADGTYSEQFAGLGDFGAPGTAPGHPQTTVARTYIGSAEITDPSYGVTLTPTLLTPGGVYKIDYNFNSVAGNTSTNIVLSVNCTSGGVLSFTETDKFQRQFGSPANQWQLLGYLTNSPGSANPVIEFRYKSGRVSGAGAGAAGNRLLFDCWRFTLVEPCLNTAGILVTGPLTTNSNQVTVTGVTEGATKITVYQNSGAGMVKIGEKTADIVAGNNTVTVSGLVRNAIVAATQTVSGQEGCVPQSGTRVGGGPNLPIRLALSLRENPTATGPAGAVGTNGWNSNIHFTPAESVLSGSSPGAGTLILYPSNDWQTVTIDRGLETIANVASASGVAEPANGYFPGQAITIKVYAFRTTTTTAVKIFSPVAAQSAAVTSNDVFSVKWTWTAVPGAEGYRLLRDMNGAGFTDFVDVTGTSYTDASAEWAAGDVVTPTSSVSTASIMWNPTVGNSNNIAGEWAALESIAIANGSTDDTGPFDIYIDNLANGTNGVFQDFEGFVAGTVAGVVFNQPSHSGTTAGYLLSAPNTADISNAAADSGTKSLRVRWQFTNQGTNSWLRLNTFQTSVMPSPLVQLSQPISFRILMQPVGAAPTPPAPPSLSANKVGADVILGWTGTHRLQSSSDVTGSYTNTGVTKGPWTNTFTEQQKFFRLRD